MPSTTDLRRAVAEALAFLSSQPGIGETEVFAGSNRSLLRAGDKGTIVWAADEVVYAPEIAVSGMHVDEIAGFMEGLD